MQFDLREDAVPTELVLALVLNTFCGLIPTVVINFTKETPEQ